MRVFEFTTQDHQAYLFAGEGGSGQCRPDPPRSLAAEWVPPTFEIVGRDEFRSYLPKTDFPTFTIATIVMSARAAERLRPIWLTCGELLPIHLSNDRDTLYLFNVTRLIDAVDMKRSVFTRFPDGGIMAYERLVFDPSQISEEPVFFKTTQLGPVTEIFANEAAVRAVKRSGLQGYEFRVAGTDQ